MRKEKSAFKSLVVLMRILFTTFSYFNKPSCANNFKTIKNYRYTKLVLICKLSLKLILLSL